MFSKAQLKTFSRLGQRGTLGVTLLEMAQSKENLMVLSADLANTSGLARFVSSCPEKFLNFGIAEMNMIIAAAGLAKEGFVPFTTTFANFAAMRSYEAIRLYMGYMKFNVKVVGMASGFSMSLFGNTHYAMEDLALMCAIPNLTVLSPADALETQKCVQAAGEFMGPVYLRLSGGANNPIVYTEDYSFEIGKAIALKNGSDVALMATGSMVYAALEAAKILEQSGISASVINFHTVKPLDCQTVIQACKNHKLIVSLEEHSIVGGLGSEIARVKSQTACSSRQVFIGVPDTFGKAGTYEYMLEQFRLTPGQIADKITDELK